MNLADSYAKLTIQLGDVEFKLASLKKEKQKILAELEKFKAVVEQIKQKKQSNEAQKPTTD